MKEMFRTNFLSNGEKRPDDESTGCIELAYNYIMKGYKVSIKDLSIICKITLYKRYTSVINFINGKKRTSNK
jgi:hypothetical protein